MSVSVRIPTILRNYTDGASEVTAEGTTLGEVLDDLESNHSGIKARVLGSTSRKLLHDTHRPVLVVRTPE